MTREIKFRGKDLESDKWLYGNLVCYEDEGEELTCIVSTSRNEVDACLEFTPVDKASVGQFTGMLDRNGNEVYEGDILNAYSCVWDRTKDVVVVYDEKHGYYKYAIVGEDGKFMYYIKNDNVVNFVVIGNIHDNKQ